MTALGNMGRFGNQVFQYAFLRIVGKELGLEVQTADWMGRYLFKGANDPLAGPHLRPLDDEPAVIDAFKNRRLFDLANHDVKGYFQIGFDFYAGYRDFLAPIFEPADNLSAETKAVSEALAARGNTVVALHIRRGDMTHKMPKAEVFRDWLEPRWAGLGNPVLYVASDGLEDVLPVFADYAPITAQETGVHVQGVDFWTDFQVLRTAQMAAISCSTFSEAAVLMNPDLQDLAQL